MRLFAFEWRKLWRRKAIIIALLIFSAIDIYKIAITLSLTGVDVETPAYRAAFNKIAARISGPFENVKTEFIIQNKNKLDSETGADKSVFLTGSLPEEKTLFRVFYMKLEYLYDYQQTTDAVVKKAEANAAFYDPLGNTYDAALNRQIAALYAGRYVSAYYPTEGYETLLDYDFSALLVLILLLLGLTPVFCGEKENGMSPLLATAKRGRGATVRAKLGVAFCYTGVVFLWFVALDILCMAVKYGLRGGGLPIYSISLYADIPLAASIVGAYALFMLYRFLGFLVFGSMVLFFSALFSNSAPVFGSSTAVLGFCLTANAFLSGDIGQTVSYFNPATLLAIREQFTEYSAMPLFGLPVPSFAVFFACGMLLTAVFAGLTVLVMRRELSVRSHPHKAWQWKVREAGA